MAFFQMDDTFHSELRVIQAGTAAFGLYSRCGLWAAEHLTDGFVPGEVAALYGTREWIERLLATGLWESTDGGYVMPDYLGRHKNWTAERIEAQRAGAAERQARARSKRRQSQAPASHGESRPESRVTHDVSNGVSSRSPSHPPLKGGGMGGAPLRGGAAPPSQDQPPASAADAPTRTNPPGYEDKAAYRRARDALAAIEPERSADLLAAANRLLAAEGYHPTVTAQYIVGAELLVLEWADPEIRDPALRQAADELGIDEAAGSAAQVSRALELLEAWNEQAETETPEEIKDLT